MTIANSSEKVLLQTPVELNDFEKQLINRLQYDLPLTNRPFNDIAIELSVKEECVINTLQNMLDRGILTRFGPLFDISKNDGAFSLCALMVPPEKLESVIELVNGYSQVAHNYLREHQWNMWFVLAAKSHSEVEQIFLDILNRTECRGINCPKQKEFFVGLYLAV